MNLYMRHVQTFGEDTSQGLVGLLEKTSTPFSPTSPRHDLCLALDEESLNEYTKIVSTNYFFVEDEPSRLLYVFKIPREISNLGDHEYIVAKDLETLGVCLPHFNRCIALKRNVHCNFGRRKPRAAFNPFALHTRTRDVLVLEYIPSTITLLDYATAVRFKAHTGALARQVLLALFAAQRKIRFTHYDLHLNNILIRKCSKRTFFLYVFEYEKTVLKRLVYTGGVFPVIFDYGFSFSRGIENSRYSNSFFYTNKGYTPFMFDEIADFKSFAVRLAFEKWCPKVVKDYADRHFLGPESTLGYKVCSETGWHKTNFRSAARIVSSTVEKILQTRHPPLLRDSPMENSSDSSSFLLNHVDDVIDLLGVLVNISNSAGDIDWTDRSQTGGSECIVSTVHRFANEFEKIEIWFSSTDEKLNLLRKIINSIDDLISSVEQHTPEERQMNFKQLVFSIIDDAGKFVSIQGLDTNVLLTAIVELSNYMEHTFHTHLAKYKKKFCSHGLTAWKLFREMEGLFENDAYSFQLDDSIVVFDTIEESTTSFSISDINIVETLNSFKHVDLQIDLLCTLDYSSETHQNGV